MDYAEALAYLDQHANYDVSGRIQSPTTERIERLLAAMGDPHRCAPVVHITGTNGKGSTAQIVTRLLMAQGLTVGTYTSPHLERVNERMTRNAVPISDDERAGWAIYFEVENADEALEKITELGGTVILEAKDTPYGRLAAAADSTGSRFKLIQAL